MIDTILQIEGEFIKFNIFFLSTKSQNLQHSNMNNNFFSEDLLLTKERK